MRARSIQLSKSINYEILSKDQIIINLKGSKQYLIVNGVCFELLVALMNLKEVDYFEFLSTYSQKYKKFKSINSLITNFLKKLQKHKIISLIE